MSIEKKIEAEVKQRFDPLKLWKECCGLTDPEWRDIFYGKWTELMRIHNKESLSGSNDMLRLEQIEEKAQQKFDGSLDWKQKCDFQDSKSRHIFAKKWQAMLNDPDERVNIGRQERIAKDTQKEKEEEIFRGINSKCPWIVNGFSCGVNGYECEMDNCAVFFMQRRLNQPVKRIETPL